MSDNKNLTNGMTESQLDAFNKIITEDIKTDNEKSEKSEEFDIADFIVKHSTNYRVKKSKAPRIIAIIAVAVIIIGICVVFAILSAGKNKNPIFGEWISTEGIEMEISEKYITIDGIGREYIFPKDEKNVIAISVNDEYFKILYKLEFGRLYIIIPSSDGESEIIEYKRNKE